MSALWATDNTLKNDGSVFQKHSFFGQILELREEPMSSGVRTTAATRIFKIIVFASLFAVANASALQTPHGCDPIQSEEVRDMTEHATGTFEVKLVPESSEDKGEGASLGRLSIDKQFSGELDAHSVGELLTATTAVKGSAGYVAIEWVTGTLHGRQGSFALQHMGTMAGGDQELTIRVVPDSGTDGLEGLEGSMTIKIEGGKHFYEMDYTLTAKR